MQLIAGATNCLLPRASSRAGCSSKPLPLHAALTQRTTPPRWPSRMLPNCCMAPAPSPPAAGAGATAAMLPNTEPGLQSGLARHSMTAVGAALDHTGVRLKVLNALSAGRVEQTRTKVATRLALTQAWHCKAHASMRAHVPVFEGCRVLHGAPSLGESSLRNAPCKRAARTCARAGLVQHHLCAPVLGVQGGKGCRQHDYSARLSWRLLLARV
jgi:hypothetical protein